MSTSKTPSPARVCAGCSRWMKAVNDAGQPVTHCEECDPIIRQGAQPEPRTPDETLAAKLDEMGRMLGNPSLRDAAKRLRELAGDKARMDWLVVNAGESREAIDWARGRAAQPTEGTDA